MWERRVRVGAEDCAASRRRTQRRRRHSYFALCCVVTWLLPAAMCVCVCRLATRSRRLTW